MPESMTATVTSGLPVVCPRPPSRRCRRRSAGRGPTRRAGSGSLGVSAAVMTWSGSAMSTPGCALSRATATSTGRSVSTASRPGTRCGARSSEPVARPLMPSAVAPAVVSARRREAGVALGLNRTSTRPGAAVFAAVAPAADVGDGAGVGGSAANAPAGASSVATRPSASPSRARRAAKRSSRTRPPRGRARTIPSYRFGTIAVIPTPPSTSANPTISSGPSASPRISQPESRPTTGNGEEARRRRLRPERAGDRLARPRRERRRERAAVQQHEDRDGSPDDPLPAFGDEGDDRDGHEGDEQLPRLQVERRLRPAVAPDVDRDRRPQDRVEQQLQGPDELAGRAPVDDRRVEQDDEAADAEDQAHELVASRPDPEEDGEQHGDPDRHRVHEHRRATGGDDLQRERHQHDAGRDLREPDREHDRDVRALGQPEATLPGEHHDDRRQAGQHAQRGVGERRHVVEADLDDDPVQAPDERQERQENERGGARMDGGDGLVGGRGDRRGGLGGDPVAVRAAVFVLRRLRGGLGHPRGAGLASGLGRTMSRTVPIRSW